jgi:hypothetical protein
MRLTFVRLLAMQLIMLGQSGERRQIAKVL